MLGVLIEPGGICVSSRSKSTSLSSSMLASWILMGGCPGGVDGGVCGPRTTSVPTRVAPMPFDVTLKLGVGIVALDSFP